MLVIFFCLSVVLSCPLLMVSELSSVLEIFSTDAVLSFIIIPTSEGNGACFVNVHALEDNRNDVGLRVKPVIRSSWKPPTGAWPKLWGRTDTMRSILIINTVISLQGQGERCFLRLLHWTRQLWQTAMLQRCSGVCWDVDDAVVMDGTVAQFA